MLKQFAGLNVTVGKVTVAEISCNKSIVVVLAVQGLSVTVGTT